MKNNNSKDILLLIGLLGAVFSFAIIFYDNRIIFLGMILCLMSSLIIEISNNLK